MTTDTKAGSVVFALDPDWSRTPSLASGAACAVPMDASPGAGATACEADIDVSGRRAWKALICELILSC